MSKSPLSGAFSGSSEPAKKKKKNGAILLIAGIALTSSIGGVFAANSITINNGDAIEFGQGVTSTSSCTTALETSMSQTFTSGGQFIVNDVVVSSIDTSRCTNVDLKVTLVDSSNAEITSTITRGDASSKTWSVSADEVTADAVRKVTVTTQD